MNSISNATSSFFVNAIESCLRADASREIDVLYLKGLSDFFIQHVNQNGASRPGKAYFAYQFKQSVLKFCNGAKTRLDTLVDRVKSSVLSFELISIPERNVPSPEVLPFSSITSTEFVMKKRRGFSLKSFCSDFSKITQDQAQQLFDFAVERWDKEMIRGCLNIPGWCPPSVDQLFIHGNRRLALTNSEQEKRDLLEGVVDSLFLQHYQQLTTQEIDFLDEWMSYFCSQDKLLVNDQLCKFILTYVYNLVKSIKEEHIYVSFLDVLEVKIKEIKSCTEFDHLDILQRISKIITLECSQKILTQVLGIAKIAYQKDLVDPVEASEEKMPLPNKRVQFCSGL